MRNRFMEMYKEKLTAPDEAVKLIESGSSVVVPLANGQPPGLLDALGNRVIRGEVREVDCFSGVEIKPNRLFTSEAAQEGAIIESGFVGPVMRYWVQKGVFTYSPGHLSESSSLLIRCRDRFETAMFVVSPMDKHGFFSTGTNNDYAWEVAKQGPDMKNIIVEVNQHMPRTYGRNTFHVSEVSAIVENHVPLVEIPALPITKEDEIIGHYIAEEVPDEACIQLGIGGIPNAVANFLINKRDLSVHSEMLVDSMVDLYEQGVITCAKKNFMPEKWMASFAMGSKKLYDFIDENPLVEMHPASTIIAPHVCGQNDKLMSINSTLEVDLTGQCASEAIGPSQYSGTGGQSDFVRGSWLSRGGKSFLACYATYTDKTGNLQSKIVPTLTPGSVVTVTRPDVQYVVTEYGIAYLKGQTLRTRVERLIQVAHPDFRDWLRSEAKRLLYIP